MAAGISMPARETGPAASRQAAVLPAWFDLGIGRIYAVPVALRFRLILFAFVFRAFGQAPIVQPGAPGTAGKVLSPASVAIAPRGTSDADTQFMQGMIHHHAQAVEMTALMKARTHNKALLKFGERITISQTDEIQFMQQWLKDRGKAVPMDMSHMDMSHGHMDHSGMMDMGSMAPMPGMLTAEQMAALKKASGAKFDHLFLTGMIQHHNGALIMVKDLFDTPGAGQDADIFNFATDVDNSQRAEIKIMQSMLDKNSTKEKQ
jgi:uncharacterized protein (DUF305 family)